MTYHGISVPVNDTPIPGFANLSWNVVAAPIVMPSVVSGPFIISEPFSVTDHVGFGSWGSVSLCSRLPRLARAIGC